MNDQPRILVATEIIADAALVRKLLLSEFEHVAISTDANQAVPDFEKYNPDILVLAFNDLEKAERYYLGLYRLSTIIHTKSHHTLILCNKDDLKRVYDLCKKNYFNDYILFWPVPDDALRLLMAIHQATQQMKCDPNANLGEIAIQTKRLVELESLLEKYTASGNKHIEVTNQSVRQAQADVLRALDKFYTNLAKGSRPGMVEIKDQVGLQKEINCLRKEEIEKHFQSVSAAVQPMRQWIDSLKAEMAPQVASARALQAITKRLHPTILIVDDDEYQHKLLAQILNEEKLDLIFTTTGAGALGALHRHQPDLVLMDINLPGIDGIEITRKIKSIELFVNIPVIMITGHSEKNVVIEALRAGAEDFVAKPFDKKVLMLKIRKFLGGDTN
jgi:CheY-like chemotaxis protein